MDVFLVASALVIQGAAFSDTDLFSALRSHVGAETRELKVWVSNEMSASGYPSLE